MNMKILLSSTFFSIIIANNSYAACTGLACDGKDPSVEGCATDAITVGSKNLSLPYAGATSKTYNVFVEQRYSPKCKTNWTRVSGAIAGKAIIMRGTPKSTTYETIIPPKSWTPMVYGYKYCTKSKYSYDFLPQMNFSVETGWSC